MQNSEAIRTENLSKTFGRSHDVVQAVRNLNLQVERGQVYGFLGPNGAGKTTTIRMLMDLIRPTIGAAYIFGIDVRQQREVRGSVGAMVETPGFYNYLSGYDNLLVLARTANLDDDRRIDLVLEQVGLAAASRRRVSGYSTGMKQRLGIASALLGDPQLILLDEPTNGLDPSGIIEMRQLIRDLVEGNGKTVFLSSHILHEVELICDRVAIIHQGECLREGAVADLLGSQADEIRLQVTPADEALAALGDRWPVSVDSDWLTVEASKEHSAEIVRRLVAHGIDVHQVLIRKQSLEEYFMEVTQVDT